MAANHTVSRHRARRVICAFMVLVLPGCILFPASIYYSSYLVPDQVDESAGYELGENNSATYYVSGSRIDVRHLTDQDLNRMYPEDSNGGRLSTNPYTYGDWVDPDLGYTPNRFTVFEVSVNNLTLPRMMLDPKKAILVTKRGRTLQSYTVSPEADRKSLEGYYRALRRISGNEYYRFAKRIGIVKGTIYGSDEVIFKGERYSGYVVFDPLRPEEQSAQLVLKSFGIEFDAFNHPTRTIDIPFQFGRRIDKHIVQGKAVEALPTTRVVVHGPADMSGNQPGDLARNVGAVNSVVGENLSSLNRCFSPSYEAGQALAGDVVVQFVIQVNGQVTDVKLVQSTIDSKAAEQCVADEVTRWWFQPAGQFTIEEGWAAQPEATAPGAPPTAPSTRSRQQHGPLVPTTVVYPFYFESAK